MGKNGDQIQRLFQSPATLFIVQYWGQIEQSVIEQMEKFAQLKSVLEDVEILWGVIDRQDSARLVAAYEGSFEVNAAKKEAS